MFEGKKILAIIPARSGSKGIVDKNIRLLDHKPLMAYTIEAAIQSQVFDHIIISTDSEAYAQIARDYGGEVPFMRPKALATDQANTHNVILHVLEMQRLRGFEYDYFMVLQPTSPLRQDYHIKEACEQLFKHNGNAIVSICALEHAVITQVQVNELGWIEPLSVPDIMAKRRQDVATYYRINGAIYMSECAYYLQHGTFYGEGCLAYIMDQKVSIDIDELWQFEYVEWLMQR